MTRTEAMNLLHSHNDPNVRAAAAVLRADAKKRKEVTDGIKEMIATLRRDFKYLCFDLDCTRRERDALRKAK